MVNRGRTSTTSAAVLGTCKRKSEMSTGRSPFIDPGGRDLDNQEGPLSRPSRLGFPPPAPCGCDVALGSGRM